MEIGKPYIFTGVDDSIHAGYFIRYTDTGKMIFQDFEDNNLHYFGIEDNIYDGIDITYFMETFAERLQNLVNNNVIITHDEDYNFRIEIPWSYNYNLSDIINNMDECLEDWFSTEWHDLPHNSISITLTKIILTFDIGKYRNIRFEHPEIKY